VFDQETHRFEYRFHDILLLLTNSGDSLLLGEEWSSTAPYMDFRLVNTEGFSDAQQGLGRQFRICYASLEFATRTRLNWLRFLRLLICLNPTGPLVYLDSLIPNIILQVCVMLSHTMMPVNCASVANIWSTATVNNIRLTTSCPLGIVELHIFVWPSSILQTISSLSDLLILYHI
jgi:hypothetical protein